MQTSEYMPVLLTSVEGFVFSRGGTCTSTNSFSIMQVINGPIAYQLEIKSGANALDPGSQANSTIGRMLTFFKTNLGGGRPGIDMMGVQGNASNFSMTFAENEAATPWSAFSIDKGFKPGESALSVFTGG